MISEVNTGESLIACNTLPPEQIARAEPRSEDPAEAVSWDEYRDLRDYSGPTSGYNPDLWLYRDRTTALLWRYMRLAVEVGRLPCLLGREFFRARVSPYSAQTFEDTVIFVHDVERCLQSLDAADKVLIAMLGMEQYTQEEAALSLTCTQRTIGRRFVEALDNLSEIFLKREILTALPEKSSNLRETCQEGKSTEFLVSDCD